MKCPIRFHDNRTHKLARHIKCIFRTLPKKASQEKVLKGPFFCSVSISAYNPGLNIMTCAHVTVYNSGFKERKVPC